MTAPNDIEAITAAVQRWVETVVIGLNLCPFAGRELRADRIRFRVTLATTESQLLESLQTELDRLDTDAAIETTLLIHPGVLQDFDDYNQFLETADDLLLAMGRDGIYQFASFHPNYQFADTQADDVENYTNRSPYPMLHLLREKSLKQAIERYPDTAQIPDNNIELTRNLGATRLKQLLQDCFK